MRRSPTSCGAVMAELDIGQHCQVEHCRQRGDLAVLSSGHGRLGPTVSSRIVVAGEGAGTGSGRSLRRQGGFVSPGSAVRCVGIFFLAPEPLEETCGLFRSEPWNFRKHALPRSLCFSSVPGQELVVSFLLLFDVGRLVLPSGPATTTLGKPLSKLFNLLLTCQMESGEVSFSPVFVASRENALSF